MVTERKPQPRGDVICENAISSPTGARRVSYINRLKKNKRRSRRMEWGERMGEFTVLMQRLLLPNI